MGKLRAKSDYEEIRKTRLLENQARLASLGLQKTISELRSITTASPNSGWSRTRVRKWQKINYGSAPLRRSPRLLGTLPKGDMGNFQDCDSEVDMKSPVVSKKRGLDPKLSPEALARRCTSKGRGSLYDPVFGICCHFCRQKKLCGEEDCKRCGDLDMDLPCIGKTECSLCHSGNGVLCRACLKVRYGEEMEEVKASKQWICPHCTEEKGINPYWICNSSLCLKKRKMVPTGIAIFRAREMGYKSVAHLLMDELRKANKRR